MGDVMDFFVDWNCKLFPTARNGILTLQDSLETMQFLYQRDRISSFCLMTEYTVSYGSVAAFLLLRDQAFRQLKAQCPKHLKLRLATSTPIFPELHQLADLELLLLNEDRLLPLTSPLAPYEDWIDVELNRLLYYSNIRPLFLSFDLTVKLCSEEVLQKLLRISNAVYQFNYRSLTDERARSVIASLLRGNSNATVLLGTSIDSLTRASFYETEYYLQCASDYFLPSEFQTLLHQGRAFWKLL